MAETTISLTAVTEKIAHWSKGLPRGTKKAAVEKAEYKGHVPPRPIPEARPVDDVPKMAHDLRLPGPHPLEYNQPITITQTKVIEEYSERDLFAMGLLNAMSNLQVKSSDRVATCLPIAREFVKAVKAYEVTQ